MVLGVSQNDPTFSPISQHIMDVVSTQNNNDD